MRRRSASLRSVLILATLVASACPADTEPKTLPPERQPPAGTFRLGYPEEPPTLNPVTDPSPASRDILRAVLPSFFLVTPSLRYEPYLLDGPPEVRRADGRMTVRFRIRDDARWSDGRSVTVEDVAFTWRVMTDPEVEAARPDGFDHLVAVEAESPRVGRLVLRPPLASWRDLFSAGRFVLPAHAAEDPSDVAAWRQGPPVSAGPFRPGRWVRGRSVTLVRDPRFWGPMPGVEAVEVAFVPDPTTAIQLLGRGSLDAVAPMAGVSWGRRLDALPRVSVSQAVGPDLVHLVLRADAIPTASVRRGMVDAVDRRRLLEVALRGEAGAAESVVAPEQRGVVPAWSGYGEGDLRPVAVPRELDLVYVRAELTDLVARYVQAELDRAGVDVELVALESDVFHGMFVPEGRFDLVIWESRIGSGPGLWPWVRMEGAAEPLTGLDDPSLAAAAERSVSGSVVALEEVQRRLADLAPVLPLYQPEVTMAWRAGVVGVRANPTADGSLWNAWMWRLPEA
jgi:peptide/nickel transport system substrate-binding protein